MKKFIFKVLIPTLVILGGLLGGLEMLLRCIPNDYKTQREYIESHADSIKVLILGSSSTSRGIVPRYLDIQPAYNCAYSARSVDYDYFILKKYINRMDSLKYVILDMNYNKMWHKMGLGKKSETYLKYYSIYWGITLYKGFNYQYELSTSFTDIPGLRYKYKKSTLEYDGYQSGGNGNYNEQKWKSDAQTRVMKNIDNKDYEYILYYTRKIVEMCKERNVRVLMVWIPVDKTYSDCFEYQRLSLINNTMVKLQNEYDNFSYLNFNDSTFSYLDMMNCNHLNREGAIKLTKKVNDFISN